MSTTVSQIVCVLRHLCARGLCLKELYLLPTIMIESALSSVNILLCPCHVSREKCWAVNPLVSIRVLPPHFCGDIRTDGVVPLGTMIFATLELEVVSISLERGQQILLSRGTLILCGGRNVCRTDEKSGT